MTVKPMVLFTDPKMTKKVLERGFPFDEPCTCGRKVSIKGYDQNSEPCSKCGQIVRYERFSRTENVAMFGLGMVGVGAVFGLKKLKRIIKG